MVHSPAQRALMTERLRRGRTPGAGTGAPAAAGAGLVELAPAEAGEPLYLVHAVAGTVHGYLPLARALAGTYRLFGLAAAGAPSDARSLRQLGARYVELVRARQPAGPYALGGWSTGGLVAYEMAQLLEEAGEKVSRLLLLDAPFQTPHELRSEEELAAEFVRDAAHLAGHGSTGVPEYSAAGVDGQLAWLAGRLGGEEGGSALREELERRFAVFRSNRRLIVGHLPKGRLEADAVLVWAADSPNRIHRPGWPTLVGGAVASATVPCDHYALLQPPAVDEVAAAVASAVAVRP